MPANHCPYCNAKNTAAIGAVAFSEQALVEHHCGHCGRLFSITDRRTGAGRDVQSLRMNSAFRAALRRNRSSNSMN